MIALSQLFAAMALIAVLGIVALCVRDVRDARRRARPTWDQLERAVFEVERGIRVLGQAVAIDKELGNFVCVDCVARRGTTARCTHVERGSGALKLPPKLAAPVPPVPPVPPAPRVEPYPERPCRSCAFLGPGRTCASCYAHLQERAARAQRILQGMGEGRVRER